MTNAVHLTEDQIDDALMGDLAAEAKSHLQGCPACAERLAAAEMPLASFKAVSTAWSERRSATLPAVVPQRAGFGARLGTQGRMAGWSAALSAALAVAIAVPVMLHEGRGTVTEGTHGSGQMAQVAPPEAAGQPELASAKSFAKAASVRDARADEQISQDNAMLQDVNRELNASTQSQAALGLLQAGDQPYNPLAKPLARDE
jgi:hypothetical protein